MFCSVAQGDTDPIDPRQRHRGKGAWPKKMAALEGRAFFLHTTCTLRARYIHAHVHVHAHVPYTMHVHVACT